MWHTQESTIEFTRMQLSNARAQRIQVDPLGSCRYATHYYTTGPGNVICLNCLAIAAVQSMEKNSIKPAVQNTVFFTAPHPQ
jgi:hypothetical protein